MRELIKTAETNDLKYFAALQESLTAWEAERKEIGEFLRKWQEGKIKTPYTQRHINVIMERLIHLTNYIADAQMRVMKMEPRISTYNILLMSYADRD